MVDVCTSQVFSIDTVQDVYFVYFAFFSRKFHPGTNNTHFHFGCFVCFSSQLPESCFQYFLLPCYCIPPISLCNSFLDIYWKKFPCPSPLLCSSPAIPSELVSSLFSLSLNSSPCMLSSPLLQISNQYLFSSHSYLFLLCL